MYGSSMGTALMGKINSVTHTKVDSSAVRMRISYYKLCVTSFVYVIYGFPRIDIDIVHNIALRKNFLHFWLWLWSPSSVIPHPWERNAIKSFHNNKISNDFHFVCYTDGSKIHGKDGFEFIVFRDGLELEHRKFRIRDKYMVFIAEH